MNECEFVSVYVAKVAGECEVVRMILAGEGIAAFVKEENFFGYVGLLDIHVMVNARNAERASACIADHRAEPVGKVELDEAISASPSAGEQQEETERQGFPILRLIRAAIRHPQRGRQWWERFIRIER